MDLRFMSCSAGMTGMASILFLLLYVPYLEFSACKTSRGLEGGDSISSTAFAFSWFLFDGNSHPPAGHPCVGQLVHQSITAESLGPIPMDWNLAISRAGAMFHAAANVCSVCSVCSGCGVRGVVQCMTSSGLGSNIYLHSQPNKGCMAGRVYGRFLAPRAQGRRA